MEEKWNAWTHGVGASLALVGLPVLIAASYIHGTVWHIVSFSIYGISLFLLYLASTLYHSFRDIKLKHIFKIVDHSAIYLLIAGTYTPFTLVILHGTLGWTVFGIIWGLALAGIAFQLLFINRFKFLSTLCYVAMGWLMLVCFKPLVAALPAAGLYWLIAGGLFYTVGALFYLYRWFPYHHAVWHVFVLAGSASHFVSVLGYVLPVPVMG